MNYIFTKPGHCQVLGTKLSETQALLLKSLESVTALCLSSFVPGIPSTAFTQTLSTNPQIPAQTPPPLSSWFLQMALLILGTLFPKCHTSHSISNPISLFFNTVTCIPSGNVLLDYNLLWARDPHLFLYTAEPSTVDSQP